MRLFAHILAVGVAILVGSTRIEAQSIDTSDAAQPACDNREASVYRCFRGGAYLAGIGPLTVPGLISQLDKYMESKGRAPRHSPQSLKIYSLPSNRKDFGQLWNFLQSNGGDICGLLPFVGKAEEYFRRTQGGSAIDQQQRDAASCLRDFCQKCPPKLPATPLPTPAAERLVNATLRWGFLNKHKGPGPRPGYECHGFYRFELLIETSLVDTWDCWIDVSPHDHCNLQGPGIKHFQLHLPFDGERRDRIEEILAKTGHKVEGECPALTAE